MQDGGLPHAGCSCERCEAAARHDPRYVASLAVVTADGPILVDATPDIRAQLRLLADVGPPATGRVDRRPLAGILLTHAHMGHYTGLVHLGYEAMHAQGIPLYATPKMNAFLRANAPWDQLVHKGEVVLHDLAPGSTVTLGGVEVSAFEVPHRNEYADTVGFRFAGPRQRIVYIPDTAPWSQWTAPLGAVLDTADVAIVDGTFYSLDELPGRDVTSTGHPLMLDTMRRFAPRVAAGLSVHFTHLNHSNPALSPSTDAARALADAGFGVVWEGAEFVL